MKSNSPITFAIRGVALAALLIGCSSSDGNNGTTGTGGSSTGGTPGTGGTTSTGGTPGTGGFSSTGGTPGTGGFSSTGGTVGSGGATSTGGIVGTGGASGEGGRAGGPGGRSGQGGTAGGAGRGGVGGASGGTAGGGSSGSFALTSMHLADGAHFDAKYTCASNNGTLGGGVNPDLEWTTPPAGTMSLAITFLDDTLIDAKMDSLGNHWAIWNIPATVTTFPEATKTLSGTLASAKQSGTYLAPCAQSLMGAMDDQYAFTIYALSTATLNVQGGTGVAQARTALAAAMSAGQVLGTAVLHGHAGLKGQ